MLSSIHISVYFISTEESRYFIASKLEIGLKKDYVALENYKQKNAIGIQMKRTSTYEWTGLSFIAKFLLHLGSFQSFNLALFFPFSSY